MGFVLGKGLESADSRLTEAVYSGNEEVRARAG
jgi:hypothetical protein